jgi:hypothetical protein
MVVDGGSLYQFAAHELQRYLGALSGAQFEIASPQEARDSSKDMPPFGQGATPRMMAAFDTLEKNEQR